EGPPLRWIMRTDFCRDLPGAGASARNRSTSGRVSPPRVSVPRRRKPRRVIPSPGREALGSLIVSIRFSVESSERRSSPPAATDQHPSSDRDADVAPKRAQIGAYLTPIAAANGVVQGN